MRARPWNQEPHLENYILGHVAAFTRGRFFDFLFRQLSMKKRVSFRDSLDRRRFSISGHDEKEAMNSVIGQQTASPTSSPSWLPLCLSLLPSLDLLLRISLLFLLSLCLLLFPITRHIHAYVHYMRGNAASKDA